MSDASTELLVDEILSSRLSDNGNRETEYVSQEEYLVWAVNHPSLPSDFLRLLMQVHTSLFVVVFSPYSHIIAPGFAHVDDFLIVLFCIQRMSLLFMFDVCVSVSVYISNVPMCMKLVTHSLQGM